MSAQTSPAHAAASSTNRWYRAGGISAIVFGISYLVIIALYIPMGAPPHGVEARLAYTAAHTQAWWGILWLSVLTDFLLLPIALALYIALKDINRNGMLVANAFVGLFVILDLALTWTNTAALITLSGSFAAATDNAQRAVILAAATYPTTILESNLVFVYNSLTLAVGILVTSLVMLRSTFGRLVAYVGLATGVLGIFAVASSFFASSVSGMAIIFTSLLTTGWYLLVGYQIFKGR